MSNQHHITAKALSANCDCYLKQPRRNRLPTTKNSLRRTAYDIGNCGSFAALLTTIYSLQSEILILQH